MCTICCTADPTPTPNICKGVRDLAADPGNPHRFWHCAHGRPVPPVSDCPADQMTGEQLIFNPSDEICEITQIVECPEPNGYFPYRKNEHKFISCHNGHGTVQTCPADLVWLAKCNKCGFEDDPCHN